MATRKRRGGGEFTKPPMSSAGLVRLLAQRGLQFADEGRAERQLFHIGYHRLIPYIRPFELPGTDHKVRPRTGFDDVLDLYSFDRDLRLVVLDGIGRVEVACRAAVTEVMSAVDGDTHWYTRPDYFRDFNDFKVLQGNVEQALEQPFPALDDYLARYSAPELPPSWLMVEILSLGQLNRLVMSLDKRSHRDAIAAAVGLSDKVLQSWLGAFVRVRNVCAHHERLWNVRFERYPVVPTGSVPWPENWAGLLEETSETFYAVASALQAMLFTVDRDGHWAARLATLLEGRSRELAEMGFPEDWLTDPFWQRAVEVDG